MTSNNPEVPRDTDLHMHGTVPLANFSVNSHPGIWKKPWYIP
jgi:hypothetical protein